MIISASDRSFILHGKAVIRLDCPVIALVENSIASIHLGQVVTNKKLPSLIIAVKMTKMSLRISFVNEHLEMIPLNKKGMSSGGYHNFNL